MRFKSLSKIFDRLNSGKQPATGGLPDPATAGAAANLVAQARQRLDGGKAIEALKLAQEVVASGGNIPGIHYFQGLCQERLGRHEEALEAYQMELSFYPDHSKAKARCVDLTQALAMPASDQSSNLSRSWNTSLPHPVLMRMQKSLHHYRYRGVPLLKNPFDMALYPMLLWSLKPRTLFEVGSKSGGSALWFGDLFQNFNLDSHVYSIDIVRVETVSHPRVTFLEGDGRALEKTLTPDFLAILPHPWLVIEDADHVYETTIATMRFFHPWLECDEYLVVEDGIISDLTQDPKCNSGPHKALKEFLGQHSNEYTIDSEYCDFFGYNMTWCTNGFLKKKSNGQNKQEAPPRNATKSLSPHADSHSTR